MKRMISLRYVISHPRPYSLGRFDIYQDLSRVIRIIVGHTLVSEDELGANTYIKEDKIGRYIVLQGEKTLEEQLYLEDTTITF